MTTHLLRIEAVNLDEVLFDTDQLSVIRGGGLLALKGVRCLEGHSIELPLLPRNPAQNAPAPAPPNLWRRLLRTLRIGRSVPPPGPLEPKTLATTAKPISCGASVGLYEVQLPDPGDARIGDRYLSEVAKRLNDVYPHHGFVVDLVPSEGGFRRAHRTVLARNRCRQLQQCTLALPAAVASGTLNGPCGWDDLRPSTEALGGLPGTKRPPPRVSQSVADRYRYGAKHKDGAIRDLIGVGVPEHAPKLSASGLDRAAFARSFEDIASGCPDYRLNNKLAILYFDGNDFGAIQDECESPEDLRAFDVALGVRRRELLRRLLIDLAADPLAWFEAPGPDGMPARRLRFELLLWGGDEIGFVVPAWLGLAALFAFYRASADWTWPRAGVEQPLTHAGALVFCDRKTPISRMTRLARELVEGVKTRARADGASNRNGFDYLTLESVDFPAEPLERYLRARYGLLADQRRTLTPAGDGADAIRELAKLRDDPHLPHGKLHEGAHALVVPLHARGEAWQKSLSALVKALEADEEAKTVKERLEAAMARLLRVQDPPDKERLEAEMARRFPVQDTPNQAWRWLHLVELWDYLGPRPAPGAKGDSP